MSDLLWELEHVSLAGVPAPRLDDVSLRIHGGVTAVLGYSGAGKTTLLNLLVGFEKPDRGVVRAFPGRAGGGPAAVRGPAPPVYWVPHNDGLWTHLTALQHLLGVAPAGHGGEGRARALAVLEAFDLGDKAGSHPDQMSQGERARLAVARALASGAGVLVMDEPLVHVDPARTGKYWDAIRAHLGATGASLVFATHAPRTVLAEAARAVCLEQGQVLYEGPVEELYYRPPTPELARCMGECNWLSPQDAQLWLGGGGCGDQSGSASGGGGGGGSGASDRPRCYRPEQIAVERAPDSPLVVKSARFGGSVAEVELWHERAGAARRFFHRPSSNHLAAGTRVVLKLCLLVCLALLVQACTGSGRGDPVIHVSAEHYWSVPAVGPRVPAPRKITIGPHGEVIVLDTAARLLFYSPTGQFLRQWNMPDGEAGNPEGAIVLKDGRIAVADTHYYRVVFFNPQGHVVKMMGTLGTGPGQFLYPVTLTQDDQENIYVCEYGGNDRVQKFTRDGKFILTFGSFGTGPGQFQRPSGLLWHEGKVYVADATNHRVEVFSDTGKYEGILGQSTPETPETPGTPRSLATRAAGASGLDLNFPYDLCLGPQESLYIVEWGAGRITQVGLDGKVRGRYGHPGGDDGEFRTPWGVGLDLSGPNPHLIVADTGNRRIVELKL